MGLFNRAGNAASQAFKPKTSVIPSALGFPSHSYSSRKLRSFSACIV